MKTVTIIVQADGSTSVGVECVKGSSCKDLTKDIEAALGKTVKDVPTREMKETAHVAARR